ncbi:MAG TPA: SPW repeat protein [Casimicrobiaceae bacterium]|nr:SPW repeat protein [Casimicrobiaceae bacterium]
MKNRRWQEWITLLLGIWLFLSPWIVRYVDTSMTASWNGWILGIAVVVFSAIALSIVKSWADIVNVVLGIWLIISPWALAFSGTSRGAETNDVIVGILVIVFAAWALGAARQHTPLPERSAS